MNSNEVVLGFVLGIVVAWAPRVILFLTLGSPSEGAALWASILIPTAILAGAIYWAARARRRGLAIGMAIYAAMAALLLGTVCILAVASCSGGFPS